VTSNTTSLAEIAGPLCVTVNPEDTGAIAAGIDALLRSPPRGTVPDSENIAFLDKFTWDPARRILRGWMENGDPGPETTG
jgi:hypothetical protein